MNIPKIIREKIEWYMWKGKMREINYEYRKYIKYDKEYEFIYYEKKIKPNFCYNYRKLNVKGKYEGYICGRGGCCYGELSKNY